MSLKKEDFREQIEKVNIQNLDPEQAGCKVYFAILEKNDDLTLSLITLKYKDFDKYELVKNKIPNNARLPRIKLKE